jgi:hypothetical protein
MSGRKEDSMKNFDRALSRPVVRIRYPEGLPMYLAEGSYPCGTRENAKVRRFATLPEAWDYADVVRAGFKGAVVDVVSVAEIFS